MNRRLFLRNGGLTGLALSTTLAYAWEQATRQRRAPGFRGPLAG